MSFHKIQRCFIGFSDQKAPSDGKILVKVLKKPLPGDRLNQQIFKNISPPGASVICLFLLCFTQIRCCAVTRGSLTPVPLSPLRRER